MRNSVKIMTMSQELSFPAEYIMIIPEYDNTSTGGE
jgi:hypothetical protein